MRILMIAPQPFFTPRGTPFSVYFRCRSLTEMGHEVDLVTYPFGRDVSIPGVRIIRTAKPPFLTSVKIGPSMAKLALDIPLFFHALFLYARGNYQLVHAHEEAVFFTLAYRLVYWRMRVLYDMHSSLPQQLKNFHFSSHPMIVGVFAWLERLSVRRAHAVITICPDLQRTVDRLRVSTPHALIENTLFDPVAFSDGGDEVDDGLIDWARFEGKKIVLYTGTFEAYQGLSLLLDCVSLVRRDHPDAVFILAGGTRAQVAAVRRAVSAAGVQSAVVLTGSVSPNVAKCFLRRASVLVSPRIGGTNTPLKIYEYLASGKPIVATRLETHTQVLDSSRAILTGATPESFASGICEALADSERRDRLATNGRAVYESAFSRTMYLQKLEEMVRASTGTRAGSPGGALAVSTRR